MLVACDNSYRAKYVMQTPYTFLLTNFVQKIMSHSCLHLIIQFIAKDEKEDKAIRASDKRFKNLERQFIESDNCICGSYLK